MAQSARVGQLCNQLITAISNLDVQNNHSTFKSLSESSQKTLRHHNHARTDPFEVDQTLDGLDERFRILDQDDLADALSSRRRELNKRQNKWTPEYLALLLELADQPATKSRIEHLDRLRPPDPTKQITWTEILADDPLDEEGIWDNVDFAAESSDGETLMSDREAADEEDTKASSVEAEDVWTRMRPLIKEVDERAVEDLVRAQFWRSSSTSSAKGTTAPASCIITELQAVRQVLFMLLGHPTSLFHTDHDGTITINDRYGLNHISPEILSRLLLSFVEWGTCLNGLRTWTAEERHTSLMQSCRAAVEERLRSFNEVISSIETSFVNPATDTIVSLLAVHEEIRLHIRPFQQLLPILHAVSASPSGEHPDFHLLELLFDQTCSAQLANDEPTYCFMSTIFFRCFDTHIRPISRWMEQGELPPARDGFFIARNENLQGTEAEQRASLWTEQYHLLRNKQSELHTPRFMHHLTDRIFTTGKSVVFLKALGTYSLLPPNKTPSFYILPSASSSLIPFPDLFSSAFDAWIADQHTSASAILRDRLLTSCGLSKALEAFEYLYFLRDGAVGDAVADIIFERLDLRTGRMADRLLLSELVGNVFSEVVVVEAGRLSVRWDPDTKETSQGVDNKPSVTILNRLRIDYQLPWPLQNVIPATSLTVYHLILTLLVQLRLSTKHLHLHRRRHRSSPHPLQTALLSHLTYFTLTLQTHLHRTLLTPSSTHLHTHLPTAPDLDALRAHHRTFIFALEEGCLLSDALRPIHDAVVGVLDLCLELGDIEEGRGSRTEERGLRQRLEGMRDRYARSLEFIVVGLRGVARAGAQASLVGLAEGLEGGRVVEGRGW
ncbi:MAG: hypothetical protein M1817_000778 [Caeruleum heppii]|nr:MAG: hypothetical protein M1817_000778 [Caeruleum heppii]